MGLVRHLNDSQRQFVAEHAYRDHLNGLSDPDIAVKYKIEVFVATSLRQWWAENRVDTPTQTDARKTAIARAEHDLAELSLWQQRLDVAYQIGIVSIVDAVREATRLVKAKTDVGIRYAKYLDLDAPLKIDVSGESQTDRDLQEAYRAHTAAFELDAPLA